MFHSLLGAMKEIAIFMVICEALLHFTPTKNYEKYIKPIIAFMVLSKIMISILSFNTSDLKNTMEDAMIRYEKQLQGIEITRTNEPDIDVSNQLNEKLNADITNIYSIKSAVLKKDINIKGVKKSILVVTIKRKNNKIVIENIDLKQNPSVEEERVKHIIADSLGADEENIKVVIES